MREIFQIKGMHCRSCELAIEQAVREVPGVTVAKANNTKQTLSVEGGGWQPSDVEKAIRKAGYSIASGQEPEDFFSHNVTDYINLLFALILFFLLFALFGIFGLGKYFNFTPQGSISLWLVLGIGLTAGFSTCMAVVGGLVLGISARHSEKFPDATTAQKFRPQIFFNIGRVFFYTVFGATIGLLGSAIRLSADWNGLFTVLIGLVMIALAIQISGIVPGFSSFFTLPTGIAKFLGIGKKKEYSHLYSFILGGLTFFLPCGFTQAMQLLAVSTGSPIKGAEIMGIFALGTAPGLLGVGGLTAILKNGKLSNFFYKFISILVLTMAIYNIQNGLNLVGYQPHHGTTKAPANPATPNPSLPTGNVQEFKATFSNENVSKTIQPNRFVVKVGQPVKIEIYAKDDGTGCMGTIMIPGIVNTPKYFKKGETAILSFTPDETGTFNMTCAMGVTSGQIIVTN